MTLRTRTDIPQEHTWDLTPLYASHDEWKEAYEATEKDMEKIVAFKGRLGESLAVFKECIDTYLAVSREFEKIYSYAHLRSDEDLTNQEHIARIQMAMNLLNRLNEATSFTTPEIMALPDETIAAYRNAEEMKAYAFHLEEILRYKPYTLGHEEEKILALAGDVAHAPSDVFSQMTNADMTFPAIKNEKGEDVPLTHGNFITFLQSDNRDVRERAFRAYYGEYRAHQHAIASALSSSVKKDHFFSRVRKHPSALEKALFADDVPKEVYTNLITTVKENLEPLFRYFRYKRKRLELDELAPYDIYTPVVPDVAFSMEYDEAVSVCLAALAPLGRAYTTTLEAGLRNGRWVDRYENRGKRSGAYSSGCYDSPPYILLNYDDANINSVYTLIHEAGHSMHSYYSHKTQPYMYADYTILVAEVASTFNETLLTEHLMTRYRDDAKMRAYLMNREIENIRTTLVRQVMFAEFEMKAHEVVEANAPLTLDVMLDIYKALLADYFGDTMRIDEDIPLECLRIPHFYSAFYVYKYATGISAALDLAKRVLASGEGERDRYLTFLTKGGSEFPLASLQAAGVDLSSGESVRNALSHLGKLVDEFITACDAL